MFNITPELRASLENAPFPRLLGFRLVELSEGYAKVAVTIRPEHFSFLGTTDGTLVMSLADYAYACSVNTLGGIRVALQSNINFLSAAPSEGEITAEATTTHAGRSVAVMDMTVADSNGRIIAKATGTAMTRPG